MNKGKTKRLINNLFSSLFNLSESKIVFYLLLGLFLVSLFFSVLGINIDEERKHVFELFDLFARKNFINTIQLAFYNLDTYICAFFAFILGVFQFSFLHSKPLATAILSLPKKRSVIFRSKVVTPLVFMSLGVIIISTIALWGNLKYNFTADATILYGYYLAYTLILVLYCLYSFAIGALATILTSRITEAIVGGIGLLALPKAILCVVDITSSAFLQGYSSYFYNANKALTLIDPTRALFGVTNDYYYGNIESAFPLESILHSAFWIVASIVILVLLKKYFCNSFKIEEIGTVSNKKYLNAISVASISVGISYLAYHIAINGFNKLFYTNPIPMHSQKTITSAFDFGGMFFPKTFLAIFTLLSVILCLVIYSALTLDIKRFKEKANATMLIIGAVILTSVIAATGGLGYKNRIPEIEKIEKAALVQPYNLIETSSDLIGFSEFTTVSPRRDEQIIYFTDEEDLKALTNFHSVAINGDYGNSNDCVKIVYQLKDGSLVERNYNLINKSVAKEFNKLWDTKAVKECYRFLLGEMSEQDKFNENFVGVYSYNSSFVEKPPYIYLHSKDGKITEVKSGPNTFVENSISTEDFNELKSAIYKDILNLTSEQWFSPTKTYGYVSFRYEPYAEEFVNSYAPFSLHNHLSFQLTSDMTNTITLLTKWNVFKSFEIKREPNKMYVGNINEILNWYKDYYNEISFESKYLKNPFYHLSSNLFTSESMLSNYILNEIEFDESENKPPVREITDKGEQMDLLNKANIKEALENDDAQLLIVTYGDGESENYQIPYDYKLDFVINQ